MEVTKLKPSSILRTSEASVMSQPPAPSTFFERRRWSSPHRERTGRALWCGRLFFIVCLVGAATALGVGALHLLSSGETELAESQFESIAERALTEAGGSLRRKKSAVLTLSSIVSEMHPNAIEWPYVYVNGFERIANNLLDTSSGEDMGFVIFVRPEELPEWEDFAYDYFYNIRGYPSNTAVNSFGRGVFGVDPNLNNTDKRYHDTYGITRHYDSPNTILAPVFHVDEGADRVLLFNMHSEPNRGRMIDDMINCTRHLEDLGAPKDHGCGSLTNMIKLVKFPENRGPGAFMYQPIYPANDPNTMVGLIPATVVWDEIFQNLFTEKVNGVEILISDGARSFTYVVRDGVASYKGRGSLHESEHKMINLRCRVLTGDEMYTDNSPVYQLCLYPTSEFYLGYATKNPRIATIGAVVIIAFSALVFLLYDFLVRREFTAKKDLLEAKRRFMRFVSHEVRTPLNSVCMGLTVIQTEIANSLGYDNAEDLELEAGGGLALARRHSTSHSLSSTRQKMADDNKKSLEWFGLAHEIRVNAMRAVDVLNDLLHYDKIEKGELNLELTVLPIWRIIEQTVNEFRLPATKKKVNLELEFGAFGTHDIEQAVEISSRAEDIPHEILSRKAIGDAVRLTQVLRNLLSNAIKFTPQKGYVRVTASWIKPDEEEYNKKKHVTENFELKDGGTESFDPSGQLRLTVQDSGVGLSEDQLARLFRDGVQFNVNDLQAGQGSGLGLFITKGIVEQHNGRLVAASDGLGMGTVFTMTLPLYYDEEAEQELVASEISDPSETSADTLCAPPVMPTTLRALVVDDVSSNRKLLCRLLKNRGHSFDEAPNGLQAIEMVTRANQEGAPYDTILMDYEMPVMNGPNAAKRIRSMGLDVFIVGITGNLLPEDVAFFKSHGANAVLGKPLAMKALEDLWREHGLVA